MKGILKSTLGVTLLEVVIATAIISIGFLGFIGAYSYISKAITTSRTRTLASNYLQEKIEKIKGLSFYRITPTVNKAFDNTFTPGIPYDTKYFPPEYLETSGTTFTRLTCIDNAQEVSGNFTPVDANSDTGVKLIKVTVIWEENGRKIKSEMTSIVTNTNMSAANATITGVVYDSLSGTLIPGAQVSIVENSGWTDTTDSNGIYTIRLMEGDYHIAATAPRYNLSAAGVSLATNENLSHDIYMVPMTSGTIKTSVWKNDHLVISQVVSSTVSADGYDQEYIELFNPTTDYIMIYDGWPPKIEVCYQWYNSALPTNFSPSLTYSITPSSVPPYSYYLIANTSTLTVCGSTVAADAYYNPSGITNLIINQDAGAVGIRYSTNSWIDKVGWERNSASQSAPFMETRAINQSWGFDANEQFVRRASTSDVNGSSGFGCSYDTNYNNIDFIVNHPISVAPRNTLIENSLVAGTPFVGVMATVSDGLSGPALSSLCGTPTYAGMPPAPNPPYAEINIVSVATGSWSVVIASAPYYYELEFATVTENTHTWIPNANTSPGYPAASYYATIFDKTTNNGFISGRVYDASGGSINPMIVSGYSTAANGTYFYMSSTGTISVVANSGNFNSKYVSLEKSVEVEQGLITSGIDFILSEGGKLSGRVTSNGLSPIPGVTLIASDSNGTTRGQEITDSNGYFVIVNLDTGTYTVEPVLDSKETSTPSNFSANVTAGNNVFAGTFTVTGMLGTISGSVSTSDGIIQTGVLLIATTSTLTADPVTFSTGTLTINAFYATSSLENGTYALEVRGSSTTKYNVYAWYPVITNGTASYSRKNQSNVTATAGNTTTGINFSW